MSVKIVFPVLVLVLLLAPRIVLSQDQAQAPVFKEGDTWQFNIGREGDTTSSTAFLDGLYEVVYTQGKVKLFKVTGSQKEEMVINPDGPSQGLLNYIGQSTQRTDLKFPLSVGAKWNYEYQVMPVGGKNTQRRVVEINVAGIEQVSTTAGSFKAFKLVREEVWTAGVGKTVKIRRTTSTYYYSPETRSVVKRSSEDETTGQKIESELVKFSAGN